MVVASGRKIAKSDEVIITRERLAAITKLETATTQRRLQLKRQRDRDLMHARSK